MLTGYRTYEVVHAKEDVFDVLCKLERTRDPDEVMKAAAKRYACVPNEARQAVIRDLYSRLGDRQGDSKKERALRLVKVGVEIMRELDHDPFRGVS